MNTYIEHVHIPDSVTSIEVCAFSNCKELKEIYIPDSVVEIKGGAFRNCISLSHVVLPNTITSINSGTFTNCISLVSINIPRSIMSIARSEGGGSHFDNVLGVWLADDCWVNQAAFENCPQLVNVNFEDLETTERLYWHFPYSPMARARSELAPGCFLCYIKHTEGA